MILLTFTAGLEADHEIIVISSWESFTALFCTLDRKFIYMTVVGDSDFMSEVIEVGNVLHFTLVSPLESWNSWFHTLP